VAQRRDVKGETTRVRRMQSSRASLRAEMETASFRRPQGARGAYVQCRQGQPATASRGCRRRAAIGASRHVRHPARTPSIGQVAGSCRLPGCYYLPAGLQPHHAGRARRVPFDRVSASRADAREACGNPGSCGPGSAALPCQPRRQPPEASGARACVGWADAVLSCPSPALRLSFFCPSPWGWLAPCRV
jgi:hypothetical protein